MRVTLERAVVGTIDFLSAEDRREVESLVVDLGGWNDDGAVSFVWDPLAFAWAHVNDHAILRLVAVHQILPSWSLAGFDFSGVDLSRTHWAGVDLSRAVFKGATLYAASFRGCYLAGSSFEGATVDRAYFEDSSLRGSTWEGASLTGPIFANCNVQWATFSGARMGDVVFRESVLLDARLSNAIAADGHTNAFCGVIVDRENVANIMRLRGGARVNESDSVVP